MSKLFTLILITATIAALVVVSFAGYVLWSAFQSETASSALIEGQPIDTEQANEEEQAIDAGQLLEGEQLLAMEETDASHQIDQSEASPIQQLANAVINPAIIILTYHHIDPDLQGNPITITPERFHEHIQALQRSDYKPISYANISRFLRISEETRGLLQLSRMLTPTEEAWVTDSLQFVKRLPRESYHITFDDGYQSFYDFAFPTLRDAQIPSTFFVIVRSSFKEAQTAPDWINYPHVTWEDLKIIQRHPLFEVQSHTYSLHSYEPGNGETIPSMTGRIHRSDLGRLESQEEFETRIYQDMILSKSYLENRLRPHIANSLSYPYGAYNNFVIEQAEKAGLEFLFTNQPGIVSNDTSPMQIPRVSAGAPEITATDLMNTMDDLFFRRSF